MLAPGYDRKAPWEATHPRERYGDRVRIGLGLPLSGAWAGPEAVAGVAVRAEELGYAELWTFQRLAVGAGEQLAPVYGSVLDPLITLAFAAARTDRIRLGVAIINLPFVAPAHLAKQAASLDVLSGGRLDLGLGTGWSAVEYALTASDGERRGARTREYVSILKSFWADDVTRFDGEFYTVPPSHMLPKPVQRPGVPILLGGAADSALRRAGRIADGWVSRSATDLAGIADQIAIVRAAAEEAGRDPDALRIATRGVVHLGAARGKHLTGTATQIRADADWLAEQGVTDLFYDLNWDPLIGAPDADPTVAAARAEEIMDTLAPKR